MVGPSEIREAAETIEFCSLEQAHELMVILCAFHDVFIFSPTTRHFERAERVSINGDAIQISASAKQSDN